MKSYVCELCDYTYVPEAGDLENGVPAGTAFEDIPDSWVCPKCGPVRKNFVLWSKMPGTPTAC